MGYFPHVLPLHRIYIDGDYDGNTVHLTMHSGEGQFACHSGDASITGTINNNRDEIDCTWTNRVDATYNSTPNRVYTENFSAKKIGSIH